jgi:hypothetical protein
MDGGAFIIELVLEILFALLDCLSWSKSRTNRRARRRAMKSGERPPFRTGWTRLFILFSFGLILMTVILVIHVIIADVSPRTHAT